MAIVPQRRTSKTRKRLRRSHFKLELPGMMVCPNCGEMKLAHTVCKECGYYDGKLVKEIKVKKTAEKEEAAETKAEAKTKTARKEVKALKDAKKGAGKVTKETKSQVKSPIKAAKKPEGK
ncbi:MAG: 50S ribosomal protein L32 [Tenericutes bacterium ADurb.BinA124]|nr:MAG: 50S ribosomal protein L32 [Tenericutes bacterium ADurb.BinA124]